MPGKTIKIGDFPWGIFICCAAIASVMLYIFPVWTVDDAFIAYRYGKNLVTAGELNWNPGEAPVEGYTGILLPLLAAACEGLGLDPVIWIKVLSVGLFLGGAALLYVILKKLNNNPLIPPVLTILYLLLPFHYTHAYSGLETSIFEFLVIGNFYAFLSFIQQPGRRQGVVLGMLLCLLGFCRPEGLLLALSFLVSWLLYGIKDGGGKEVFRKMMWPLVTFLVPACIYFAWRMYYYGEVFPNTFYAKRYGNGVNLDGILGIVRFGIKFFGVPALWIIAMRVFRGMKHTGAETKTLRTTVQRSAIFWVLALSASFLFSHLYMNYSYRFFVPMVPAIYIFLATSIGLSPENTGQKILIGSLIGMMLLQAMVVAWNLKDELFFTNYYHSIVEDEYLPAAKLIQEKMPPDAFLAVYMDAGAIPYYTDLKTLDMGRLNDPFLAKNHPGTQGSGGVDYFYQKSPDVLVMTSFSRDSVDYVPEAMQLVRDPRFSAYRLVKKFGNSAMFPYYQFVYFKAGLE